MKVRKVGEKMKGCKMGWGNEHMKGNWEKVG